MKPTNPRLSARNLSETTDFVKHWCKKLSGLPDHAKHWCKKLSGLPDHPKHWWCTVSDHSGNLKHEPRGVSLACNGITADCAIFAR